MLWVSCPFIQRVPSGTIIDHSCIDLTMVPVSAIQNAKSTLRIAYGHTSHGSQITTGMNGLVAFANGSGLEGEFSAYANLFAWNADGSGGALCLEDSPFAGASDLGNPNLTAWEAATLTYLNSNADVNVVIWSWCGQVSGASEAQIANYLSLMNQLETDYPGV
ncbi:MAG: hypothetical protein EHM28_10425, partial [Spirochaetaceae bacterium]